MSTSPASSPAAQDPRVIVDHIEYWNTEAGRIWVERQELWDATLRPLGEAAMARAAVRPGESVIDIGCGCGATTLQLAERVGPGGRVLGIDVSKPMLAQARRRASGQGNAGMGNVTFVEADATTHGFEAATADLLFSRLGVMFFPDPVKAFANLRGALEGNGRLAFVCFRSPKENQFLMTSLHAVTQFVPPLPKLAPEDPGPFSLADEGRTRRILGEAGFAAIEMTPMEFQLDVGSGRGFETAVENALEIGPAARALQGQPADLRAKAEAALRAELKAHERDGKVPLTAAVWIVTARNA